MDRNELEKELSEAGVRKDLYSLYGGLPTEAYCMNQDGNQWIVYYSERGLKSDIRYFSSESDACDYAYMKILSYK